MEPVHRLVSLLDDLLVAVDVEAPQPWEVVGDAEGVEEAEGGEHGVHVQHLHRPGPAVRLGLAKVAHVEHEAADDVAAVVTSNVPDVDDVAGGSGGEVVDVAGEVVSLVGALVVEPRVARRADDLGGEDAAHLLPLVAVGREHGVPVAAAERLGRESERAGYEVCVLLPEHLPRDLRAGDGHDVDAAELDASDVRAHLAHHLMDPAECRLVQQHLRQVADDGPRQGPGRERRVANARGGARCAAALSGGFAWPAQGSGQVRERHYE